MRTFEQLRDAIISAIPLRKELEALTEEQIQDLRKYDNNIANQLYIQTREWKEWRAANPPPEIDPTRCKHQWVGIDHMMWKCALCSVIRDHA